MRRGRSERRSETRLHDLPSPLLGEGKPGDVIIREMRRPFVRGERLWN